MNFDNTYLKLPQKFYKKTQAQKVFKPQLVEFNKKLAMSLGFDFQGLADQDLAQFFSGQKKIKGSEFISLAYAGHQFGHFVPQLGDGRALLMGEVVSEEGKRFDIQLKGSGPTFYSRNGDGQSSLGPVIREYIVSEAMHHLGIPTTRALAAVTTGESVYRETELPGGIFTRVAQSHIRIGTFQYFACRKDIESLKKLTDYSIERHYPEVRNKEGNIYLSFLNAVAHAQSSMVAHWMSVGFIHGVMNTDNMSITGETLDYGPCAFMDQFSSDKVFSSIDRNGRYAYKNQIPIAKWNLYRLAECLIPLVDEDQDKALQIIEASIDNYIDIYEEKYLKKMISKFGIFESNPEDIKLINYFLNYLEEENLDFTNSFRRLSGPLDNFKKTPAFEVFYSQWSSRRSTQAQSLEESVVLMNKVNPVFIPRNHQVERAIQGSLEFDFSVFKEMNDLLEQPYTEQPSYSAYKELPKEEEVVHATFCGT